jgi:hypothetical protein
MLSFFAPYLFPFDCAFLSRFGLSSSLLAVVLLAGSGCSQVARPDFSGRWELDVSQSDFGPVPGPSQSTQVIEHQDPVLRLTADSVGFMGEDHAEFEFQTDGSDAIQTVEGRARKTQSYWEDAVLITEWEVENPGQPRFEMIDRRSLSEDGQTMVVDRLVRSSWDEWEQKAVYTRKPSG